MAREYIHGNGDLNYMNEALENRKREIEFIEDIASEISKYKDRVDSLVVSMEADGKTYTNYFGSISGCYGLTKRLQIELESDMYPSLRHMNGEGLE
jgi:hypothetical protein